MSEKQRRGVLVTISQEDGKLLLRLDDVVQESKGSKVWRDDVLYTYKPITREQLDSPETVDSKELADFGYAILARLYAFAQCNEI